MASVGAVGAFLSEQKRKLSATSSSSTIDDPNAPHRSSVVIKPFPQYPPKWIADARKKAEANEGADGGKGGCCSCMVCSSSSSSSASSVSSYCCCISHPLWLLCCSCRHPHGRAIEDTNN